ACALQLLHTEIAPRIDADFAQKGHPLSQTRQAHGADCRGAAQRAGEIVDHHLLARGGEDAVAAEYEIWIQLSDDENLQMPSSGRYRANPFTTRLMTFASEGESGLSPSARLRKNARSCPAITSSTVTF